MTVGEVVPAWQGEESIDNDFGETPAMRERSLKNLRAKIQTKLSDGRFRQDDFFLLCFLRSRKYDVDRAFKCYQRYYKVQSAYPDIMYPAGVAPLDRVRFYEMNNVTVQCRRNPTDGCTIYIWRMGAWVPGSSEWDLADHLTPSYWMIEQVLREPVVQNRGLHLIIDGNGISWSMLPYLKLTVFKVLVHTVQDAFPARFKAIHVVNQPGLYDYIYACIRPFLKPKIVKRIHLHGSDLKSLHEHIDPEILPEEYGGQAGPFSNEWICQQLYQRDEEFRKYSHYGFARDGK
ncbi:alpha-tocopherol transfer protein-like [Tropilaelaps mercedesae]|uniref:Alpha-tocopherol transfer protein-like n=1 Tax=Tropilaelaps mercedesae TaxID=418985 RepID=A0A1V9X769_9ACAR|nr:alpha-tocopherol transfer protein-like [Tropilaelaps mercedesae]